MLIARPLALLLLLTGVVAAHAQTAVNWRTLKSGTKSNEPRARRIVLQTEDKFSTYWQHNFGTVKPPPISWDRERVVAIHLGHRGSYGYSVVVTNVVQQGEGIVVYWHEALPLPTAKYRSGETSPYTIIAVPNSNGRVRFEGTIKDPLNELAAGDAFPKKQFLSGAHCFVAKETTQVIEDQGTLASVWSTAFGHGTQPPAADFSHSKLAAIFLGQRPTPGYAIVIGRIARIGPHEVQIQYSETKPAKDAILPQMVTNPFVILELPKTDDTITIERAS